MKIRSIPGSRFAIILFCIFLSLPLSVRAEETVIRVLHMNDFHGFAEPHRPYGSDQMLGGIAYLAARVNDLRKERPSLLLAAGDMIQGNNWANFFRGESVIQLMNAMRFDAMVAGNHEFDFGQEILKERISGTHFPVLGANVQGLDGLKPFIIREVSGVRIALIGVVTEDTAVTTHPRNVAGLRFDSPSETVEKCLKELKQQADIVIILSHIGYLADRALAEKVTGIDAVVGGHSHTRLDKPAMIGKTAIVQAWEHGKALGVLDLTVKDGKITNVDGRLEEIVPAADKEDKGILAIVDEYNRKVTAALGEAVGLTEVELDGENVRKRETNLGNFITDVMKQTSGADVAIVNGGDIRTSINKGMIRLKDVYDVLPFNDYIIAMRLTGRQLSEALEHGVSAIEEGGGRFPQVSGLSFTYSRSEKEGSRVKTVLIAGKPLEPDREYVVATNDFLAAGGDGYKVFGDAVKASGDFSAMKLKKEKIAYSDSSRWLKDVVADYLRSKKTIAPGVEGRIREIP